VTEVAQLRAPLRRQLQTEHAEAGDALDDLDRVDVLLVDLGRQRRQLAPGEGSHLVPDGALLGGEIDHL
jgi:hypothetical protein